MDRQQVTSLMRADLLSQDRYHDQSECASAVAVPDLGRSGLLIGNRSIALRQGDKIKVAALVYTTGEQMRALRIIFIMCSFWLAGPVWADMSGTYIGEGASGAIMIEIIEANGGNLTGRYTQVALTHDGLMREFNGNITGIRKGESVVGTLKGADVFAPSIPISGLFGDRGFHLTMGLDLVQDLYRGKESDFRTLVTKLIRNGQQIREVIRRQEASQREADIEAKRIIRLQDLAGRLAQFTTRADTMIPDFNSKRTLYRSITDRMRSGLARQRTISGGVQASFARSQIAISLGQLAIEAEGIRFRDMQLSKNFDDISGLLGRETAEVSEWCLGTISAALAAPCRVFRENQMTFTSRVAVLRSAFSELGAAWITERETQEAILRDSQKIE